jgi:hypothetical protein
VSSVKQRLGWLVGDSVGIDVRTLDTSGVGGVRIDAIVLAA